MYTVPVFDITVARRGASRSTSPFAASKKLPAGSRARLMTPRIVAGPLTYTFRLPAPLTPIAPPGVEGEVLENVGRVAVQA